MHMMQPAWKRSRNIIRSGLVHDRTDAAEHDTV